MKYSIKSQMIAIFVGLTGCLLFALLFINMNFLKPEGRRVYKDVRKA